MGFAYLLLLALLTVLQSLDDIFSLQCSNSSCLSMICDQHCNVAMQALKKVVTEDPAGLTTTSVQHKK